MLISINNFAYFYRNAPEYYWKSTATTKKTYITFTWNPHDIEYAQPIKYARKRYLENRTIPNEQWNVVEV